MNHYWSAKRPVLIRSVSSTGQY